MPAIPGPSRAAVTRIADAKAAGPLTRQLIPVSARAEPPFAAVGSCLSSGVLGGTSCVRQLVTVTSSGIVLLFGNYYNNSGDETDGPSAITIVEVDFEPDTGTRTYEKIPVWFNGSRTITIAPGALVASDPIPVSVVKGQRPWIFTHHTVADGNFPLVFTPLYNDAEGHNYANPAGANKAASGTGSVGNFVQTGRMYGPFGMLGRPAKPVSVLGCVTDSNGAGTGDGGTNIDKGWIKRILGTDFSYQRVSAFGTLAKRWTDNAGLISWRRKSVLDRLGVTHYLMPLGTNDVNTGRTLAQTQAALIAAWLERANTGKPIMVATLPPITTSTDAWTTTGAQAVTSNEAARVAVNTWLRDGAPILAGAAAAVGSSAVGTLRMGAVGHPVADYLELADVLETARNSGIWKATGRVVSDAAITTGTNTLTSATAAFSAADTGKIVTVAGAAAAGATLAATMTYVNATTVTLSTNAGTTVSGAVARIRAGDVTPDGVHMGGGSDAVNGGHSLVAATPAVANKLKAFLGTVTS